MERSGSVLFYEGLSSKVILLIIGSCIMLAGIYLVCREQLRGGRPIQSVKE